MKTGILFIQMLWIIYTMLWCGQMFSYKKFVYSYPRRYPLYHSINLFTDKKKFFNFNNLNNIQVCLLFKCNFILKKKQSWMTRKLNNFPKGHTHTSLFNIHIDSLLEIVYFKTNIDIQD